MWSRPIPKHKAIHPISTVQIGQVSRFFKTLAMWVQLRLQAAGFIWLVVSTPLKNMKVEWDYYSQYMESHKIPCFKPPTSLCLCVAVLVNISLVTDGRSNSPVFDGPGHRGHSKSSWSQGSSCRVRDDWYPKMSCPRAKNIVLRYVHWILFESPHLWPLWSGPLLLDSN